MSLPVYAGGSTGFGEGGLGGHLRFVRDAAELAGRDVRVLCRGTPSSAAAGFDLVPSPAWFKGIKYTPLRWATAWQTRRIGEQFDRLAARRLPDAPVIYHSFPGFAEKSFRKVKDEGGVTVLEAATTHAEHVYAVTDAEHRKYGLGGNPFSPAWVRRALREYELADFISVASKLQVQTFLDRGIPQGKLLYAPLGVDTGRFRPADAAAFGRRRKRDDPFRVIQVGQLSLRKGFFYLLEAVRLLRDPRIEIRLIGGVGRRAIREALDRYRTMGLRIVQQSGDPLPHLRESHLYVHSSVEDGFGLAPLEAMAAGLPVVVTDQTGMRDLVEDGRDGVIAPSRDAGRIAEAIARFMEDEDARLETARLAARKAARFDARSCAETYAEAMRPAWGAGWGGTRHDRARA